MSVIFSTRQGIVVRENDDGSRSWSGCYEGTAIKKAIPFDDGKCCVVLLDPDAGNRRVFDNLLCIDQDERVVWKGRLHAVPDAFTEAVSAPEGIVANTWSGFRIILDLHTGHELQRTFVK